MFGQNHTWQPPYCVWANPCLAATSLFERNHTGSRVEHEPEAENQGEPVATAGPGRPEAEGREKAEAGG